MEDKNCELLFEYLRSILFDSNPQSLELDALDEPFQKLGKGMKFLEQAVREMKSYSAALASGNLTEYSPARDNFLCENLKNIHANLNHLTWQAKQVAMGDYSQKVSYLGEFSTAFNTMTAQLKERELSLKTEAMKEKKHADLAENYSNLLLDLIKRSQEDILVTHVDKPLILFTSNHNICEAQSQELYRIFLDKQKRHELQKSKQNASCEWTWTTEDSSHRFYQIITVLTKWQGKPAYAHIIHDITAEKLEHEKLKQEVFLDALTHIGNRHYFQHQANRLLQEHEDLTFCYFDLNHLKYVNDTYGHKEGDHYILLFTQTAAHIIREKDIFARIGGDEFCLIFRNCPQKAVRYKITQIQSIFSSEPPQDYEKSFCYGLVHLPKDHPDISLEDILQQADAAMYEQKKRAHKNRD